MKQKLLTLATALLLSLPAAFTALADTPAQYPGGEEAMKQFIAENLHYPATAKENGIEGLVRLDVTICPDGTVGPVKVVKMIDPDLEAEAIRIVKAMPAWTAATGDGGAVSSVTRVEVLFQIEE